MMAVYVTLHALRRYRERVSNVSIVEAYRALSTPVFDAVDRLGGGAVILPSGHRAVCIDGHVVTVLPKGKRFMGRREH